jgi:hypothetical protein
LFHSQPSFVSFFEYYTTALKQNAWLLSACVDLGFPPFAYLFWMCQYEAGRYNPSMETDPNSLDPELRTARLTSIASASFGVLSLCLSIIPACGGVTSVLGILLGLSSLRTEHSRTAIFGIAFSVLGMLITLVYGLFLYFFQ